MHKNDLIDDKDLSLFRTSLLNAVLLTAFFVGSFIATLSLFDVFPLTRLYMSILYGYNVANLLAYFLLKQNQKNYFLAVNIATFSSLATFIVMTITVLHDEFRIVWFFLTSFGSFILGGRRYGFFITTIIIAIVVYLYNTLDINLSVYTIFTFIIALFVFNIFSFYFLRKIESDSKRLEERVTEEVEKRQLQEQILLRQHHMANMGSMIDTIAHQWRQPLMQNSMMLLNLYDEVESADCDKVYVLKKIESLSRVNTHMSQTIEDFRNLLNHDKTVTLVKLDEVIEKVLALMKNNLKEITVTHEKCETSVLALKSELTQVLIILISNSIEALNNKKVNEKFIKINIEKVDNDVEVTVEDNAGGINNSIIKKIFDPYFTTKKQQGGTGLGLYIVQLIVEQNIQGSIAVENTLDGVRFKIRLRGEEDGAKKI
ncbi:MAG TPA: HAMP domain-containing histidine kinase [Campylobacterales bacterium]|nr:HAMP domain-containing histidine kinase [Campylobacterales bacterium]